jgi:hypothetical protein
VDGKARGSREEWKWTGSPLTITLKISLVQMNKIIMM